MNEQPEPVGVEIGQESIDALHGHDLMALFDELSFREKWRHVFAGLKQPRTNGEHKWARLQLLRLLSPLMAVVVPILILGLILLLAQITPEPPPRPHPITVVPDRPDEILDEIVDPVVEPPDPIDPLKVLIETPSTIQTELADALAPAVETASEPQLTTLVSIPQAVSPLVMRLPPTPRSEVGRTKALIAGEAEHTSLPVLRALRWLAKNQNTDGSWGTSKPAMTSLALLAYLAHNDTPESDEFGRTVEAGLRYLVDAQKPDGRFAGADGHDYTQPIAAYALAEASGMVKHPTIRQAAVKALAVVVNGQNASGGFDYGLKPGGTGRDDTSYMAWCVQALKAGKIAGLAYDVPGLDDAMQKAVLGFRQNYGEKDGYGGFGYTGPSTAHGLSGAGVLCLQILGEGASREVRSTLPLLQQKWAFNWDEPPAGSVVYYWYYITQAVFHEGGAAWKHWNPQFSHGLVKAQEVVGKDASGYVDHEGNTQEIGSWTSPAKNEHNGGNGKVMDTILCTLMLEVYYRYLPRFLEGPEAGGQQVLGSEGDLEIEITESRGLAPGV